jgi:poly-gamma-glutamate capsule biosynthesis protein CapA/YwtB (metallophosphatase superfamily)
MPSLAGRFGYPDRIAYSTTKRGLVGSAKTLAMELGSDGITSNTIHPGAVAGERIDRVLQGRADASGLSLDEVRRQAMVNESNQEFIDPADIAALVLFLAGPHARTISGQLFPIDGDSNPPGDPSRVSPDRQAAQDRDDFAVRSSRWGVGRVPVPRFTREARRASRRRALGFRCPASAG